MNNGRKWQKILIFFIFSFLVISATTFPWRIWFNIAPYLTMLEGEEYLLELNSPLGLHIKGNKEGIVQVNDKVICIEGNNLKGPLSMKALQFGQVTLEFQLFGVIPLRQVTVNVLPEKNVMPGGHSIGIKLKAEGVMVVGFNMIDNNGRLFSPARDAGIKIGDFITEINGKSVKDLVQTGELIKQESSKEEKLSLTIKRGNEKLKVKVSPMYCNETQKFQIGLYIRDSAAGVGTMTFYEPNSGIYGALGHVIADLETNKPININQGQIVRADIVNIKEARKGSPGEKKGVFVEGNDIIGSIEKNTEQGIFGTLIEIEDHSLYEQPLPIGLMNDLETGPASILTVIEGDKIEEFTIEIQRVNSQGAPGSKGLILEVTDERLLEKTGGIVQGMSGSPIIQNGKLVGAVTHVFVNDPARGYGTFLEWMLMESGILEVIDDL